MSRWLVGVALAVMSSWAPAFADTTGVTIDGLVAHPLHLTEAELAALPATAVDASFQTKRGRETGHYQGVLLWALAGKAGFAVEPGDTRNRLRHVFLITGKDGYAVAIAVGEIAPDLEGKKVILAYARNGKMLASDDLRLIVPGDKHGARAVRDVLRIELK